MTDENKLAVLALKAVSYMFLMPLAGTMCFGFALNLYFVLFKDRDFFYTGSMFTDIISIIATGYCFYFALTESLKVSRTVRGIQQKARPRPRLRKLDDDRDDDSKNSP